MGRNKLLIGGIVVVAAIVIVYFAFLYPPVSKEDTSGAIGAAKKYRSEQITDRDVMLQDEENAAVAALAAMSSEEKAAFFEKTTAELQGRALSSASPEVVAALVERAGKDILAQLGKTAPAQQVVDMFARLPKPAQDATLQRINMNAQAFAKLPLEERARNILAKASNPDIAAMVKAANMQERRDILVNCKDLALKGEIMTLLSREEKATLMGQAPAPVVADMERADFAATFFGKVAPADQFEMLGKAAPDMAASLVERANSDLQAQLGKTAPAQQVVDMFARLPKPAQDATLQRINMNAQAFAKLPLEERAKNILAKASSPDIAAMVKAANMQERRDILVNCKDLALKSEFVNLLPRADRADLMGLASASIRTEFDAATKAMMESERASRPRD